MGEFFSTNILEWYKNNQRDLPWRSTKNPFLIWISEIILQQTQVKTGLKYYEKFSSRFKDVNQLANASEEEVLNLWQGLGYYSRARNLHFSAKYISNELAGKFPESYKEIIKLKGVGHYTAAAISSFAFGEHVAVLDGNVFRVLSRFFGVSDPINKPKGVKTFTELSQSLLPNKDSDTYNQGIMEFGALQCVPKNPNCQECPLKNKCSAFSENKVEFYPVKMGKTKVTPIWIDFFIIRSKENILLTQRSEKGIWARLWEFPNHTSYNKISVSESLENLNISKADILFSSPEYNHLLSHRKITAQFHLIETEGFKQVSKSYVQVHCNAIFTKPIHRLMEKFLEDNPSLFED